ncbi:SGNH hydrolase [Dictyobacter sp. S3.2.2.5]|uniref:SGNH hydrolase n=1 Tax=Dictyobacter halimunensis TaxID=3026934 RepID=A0ABQ6G1U5_9CHLR|nr:SGNH hydrolase [Dictyobacter sp. S3.2.2.5]
MTLSSLSVGPVLQGPVLSSGTQAVRFAGQESVTLAPGQDVVSDPVTLRVEAFSDLAITFFVAEGECLTGHMGAQQTSYVSGTSDVSAAPAETTFLVYPLQTTSWWLITGIDVVPSAPLNAVVTFGSSTTDGTGSTLNANRRWPDYLARRLRDAGGTRLMSVLNAGLGGNQLTSSEILDAGEAGIPPFLFGEAGRTRLAWDVLAQAGATDLILHIGSNDLRFGVAGATLIETFQQVARQARQTYQRVFGTTILPGGYPPEQVAQRQLVNTWLREQGNQWFDAIFDLAAPLASADNEAIIRQECDSGDGIHPNDEGYRRMAAAIDITRLTGSPA